MLKEKIIEATKPVLQSETLFELNRLKTFVDASLKETLTKKFDDDNDKMKYLIQSLYQIRDYVLSQITENSLRKSLVDEFQNIEREIEMGNDGQLQAKEFVSNLNESLESDQTK